VTGLRRAEAALLAGISVEYHTGLERGRATGVSEGLLEGIAYALQLILDSLAGTDLPSNRYQEIAPKVKDLFDRYGLEYKTGSLPRQVASAWHKVIRLSLPNNFMGTNATPAALPQRGPKPAKIAA
jgi:transcriptional regulator with XRE-family HTH domain